MSACASELVSVYGYLVLVDAIVGNLFFPLDVAMVLNLFFIMATGLNREKEDAAIEQVSEYVKKRLSERLNE